MAKKPISKIIMTSTVNDGYKLNALDTIKEEYTFRASGGITINMTYKDENGEESVKTKKTKVSPDVAVKMLKQLEKLLKYDAIDDIEETGTWNLSVIYDDKSKVECSGKLSCFIDIGKTEMNKYLRTRIPAGEKYKFFNVSCNLFRDRNEEAVEEKHRQEQARIKAEKEAELQRQKDLNPYGFESLTFRVLNSNFCKDLDYPKFSVFVEDGILKGYTQNTIYKGLPCNKKSDVVILGVDNKDWVKKLEELKVNEWKQEYVDEDSAKYKGVEWTLEYKSKEIGKISSRGMNAFPSQWVSFVGLMICAGLPDGRALDGFYKKIRVPYNADVELYYLAKIFKECLLRLSQNYNKYCIEDINECIAEAAKEKNKILGVILDKFSMSSRFDPTLGVSNAEKCISSLEKDLSDKTIDEICVILSALWMLKQNRVAFDEELLVNVFERFEAVNKLCPCTTSVGMITRLMPYKSPTGFSKKYEDSEYINQELYADESKLADEYYDDAEDYSDYLDKIEAFVSSLGYVWDFGYTASNKDGDFYKITSDDNGDSYVVLSISGIRQATEEEVKLINEFVIEVPKEPEDFGLTGRLRKYKELTGNNYPMLEMLDLGEEKLLALVNDDIDKLEKKAVEQKEKVNDTEEDLPEIVSSLEAVLDENIEEETNENFAGVLNHICWCYEDNVDVYISATAIYNVPGYPETFNEFRGICSVDPERIENEDGTKSAFIYTSKRMAEEDNPKHLWKWSIRQALIDALNSSEVTDLVINPSNHYFILDKDRIEEIVRMMNDSTE